VRVAAPRGSRSIGVTSKVSARHHTHGREGRAVTDGIEASRQRRRRSRRRPPGPAMITNGQFARAVVSAPAHAGSLHLRTLHAALRMADVDFVLEAARAGEWPARRDACMVPKSTPTSRVAERGPQRGAGVRSAPASAGSHRRPCRPRSGRPAWTGGPSRPRAGSHKWNAPIPACSVCTKIRAAVKSGPPEKSPRVTSHFPIAAKLVAAQRLRPAAAARSALLHARDDTPACSRRHACSARSQAASGIYAPRYERRGQQSWVGRREHAAADVGAARAQ